VNAGALLNVTLEGAYVVLLGGASRAVLEIPPVFIQAVVILNALESFTGFITAIADVDMHYAKCGTKEIVGPLHIHDSQVLIVVSIRSFGFRLEPFVDMDFGQVPQARAGIKVFVRREGDPTEKYT